MKGFVLPLLFALATLSTQAFAAPQERWVLLGDSIQAQVFEPSGIVPQAKLLTANRITQNLNVQIQNISSPGMSMAVNGTGWDAYSNRTALRLIDGFFGAKGIVITLGTNDWGTPSINTSMFFEQYKATVQYAKSLGLQVVCVSPIWRADQDQYKASGSDSYQLWVYRWVVQEACTQGGGIYVDGSTAPLLPEHFADGLHLNGAGHGVFSSWLTSKMKALGFWNAPY